MTENMELLYAWVYYKLKEESISKDELTFVETIRDVLLENAELKKELDKLKRKTCGSPSQLSH